MFTPGGTDGPSEPLQSGPRPSTPALDAAARPSSGAAVAYGAHGSVGSSSNRSVGSRAREGTGHWSRGRQAESGEDRARDGRFEDGCDEAQATVALRALLNVHGEGSS
jgi:hypothetical protein